jgi:hypothetical protein
VNEPDLDADPPPLPKTTDGRSPLELVTSGDNRWPNTGHVYIPPHLSGRDRRTFLRTLLLAEPEEAADADRRRDGFTRAGGDVVCEQCGEKLYDHPADPRDAFLTITCSRERVKL